MVVSDVDTTSVSSATINDASDARPSTHDWAVDMVRFREIMEVGLTGAGGFVARRSGRESVRQPEEREQARIDEGGDAHDAAARHLHDVDAERVVAAAR